MKIYTQSCCFVTVCCSLKRWKLAWFGHVTCQDSLSKSSRGNAGWTTLKSGHSCPCQNAHKDFLQKRLEEELCWIALIRVPPTPPPQTTQSVKGLSWTAMYQWGLLTSLSVYWCWGSFLASGRVQLQIDFESGYNLILKCLQRVESSTGALSLNKILIFFLSVIVTVFRVQGFPVSCICKPWHRMTDHHPNDLLHCPVISMNCGTEWNIIPQMIFCIRQ